ncbi:putative hydrolase C777.06c isoform X2 [Ziziphus jujuba]|nr:putative hydrolase C777.06c isoform X2 [Ziziphus jujuba]
MFPFVSLSLSLSLALCLFIPRFSLRTYREHGNPMAAQNLADNGDFHAPSPIAADGDARSALIFLGTGCSSAIPNAMCLIQPSHPPCSVCSQALSIPPEQNPNYRCNTSLLIDYCRSDGNHSYVLIDVGKTFREQVLRWFTRYNIPQVDSIVLTHEHADAVLGLDDIRAVQPYSATNSIDPTPIYVTEYAMQSLAVKFPYLVQKKMKEGQEVRRVAQLDWRIIEESYEKPFVASGIKFVPLPVMHGEDYICLGFLFGEKSRVAYISDVSRFIPSTENVISKGGDGQLDLLILDTLYKNGSHNTHFCLPQTLDAVKRICPKQALLIGMTHEFDHHKDNKYLMEWSRR